MITHRLTGGSGSAQTFKTLWSRRRPEFDWFNDWTERQSFFSGIMCQCWSNHGGCVVLDETVVIWWQIRSRSEWEREGPEWKSPSNSIKARLLFLDTFRCVVVHTQIPYCRRKYNLFSGEPFSSIDSELSIGVGAKIETIGEEIKSQVALLHWRDPHKSKCYVF